MKTKGFVLFTTMLMLSMLTLLILSLMQELLLFVKAGNKLAKRHQSFYQLEAAAHELRVSHFANQENQCTVEERASHDVIVRIKQGDGCEKIMRQRVYLYLIEDLGDFPCLQILSKHLVWSSHHWRLTVVSKTQSHEMLQLRFAQKVALKKCTAKTVDIVEGVVNWRHLTTT